MKSQYQKIAKQVYFKQLFLSLQISLDISALIYLNVIYLNVIFEKLVFLRRSVFVDTELTVFMCTTYHF